MNLFSGVPGVLALIFALLLLAAFGWWLRRRLDGHARGFRSHLRGMEKEIGAANRYQTPWVLLTGETGDVAASLCRSWRLTPEGQRAWFGQWWYGSDGALLVTPTDLFHHAEGTVPQRLAWRRLLGALLRTRAGRPLDAVIWAVPARALWSDTSAVATGLAAHRKFADLQQRLGFEPAGLYCGHRYRKRAGHAGAGAAPAR